MLDRRHLAVARNTATLEGLAAGEGLGCSTADRRDTLVGRGLSRVGVLGRLEVRGGRQLLVEFKVYLLAIKQFLDDLVRRLLAAGLEKAIGLENLAAGVLVIWVSQDHAQGGCGGGRGAVRGSRLLLARPLSDLLSNDAFRRVKLAPEFVLPVRVAALVFIPALTLAYPVLAKLSFEVGNVHPVGEATHELCGERVILAA